MDTKKFLQLLSFCLIIFFAVSCENNTPPPGGGVVVKGPRDLTYSGDNLQVFLNGKELDFVKSATIESTLIEESIDPNSKYESDPQYISTITMIDFPKVGSKTIIDNVSLNLSDFNGKTEIENIFYSIYGTFSGGPLDLPEDKGCIIYFTTIE